MIKDPLDNLEVAIILCEGLVYLLLFLAILGLFKLLLSLV